MVITGTMLGVFPLLGKGKTLYFGELHRKNEDLIQSFTLSKLLSFGFAFPSHFIQTTKFLKAEDMGELHTIRGLTKVKVKKSNFILVNVATRSEAVPRSAFRAPHSALRKAVPHLTTSKN